MVDDNKTQSIKNLADELKKRISEDSNDSETLNVDEKISDKKKEKVTNDVNDSDKILKKDDSSKKFLMK